MREVAFPRLAMVLAMSVITSATIFYVLAGVVAFLALAAWLVCVPAAKEA